MSRAFISNGVTELEVMVIDVERGRMGVLEWDSEDHGLLYQMTVKEATAGGFAAIVKE